MNGVKIVNIFLSKNKRKFFLTLLIQVNEYKFAVIEKFVKFQAFFEIIMRKKLFTGYSELYSLVTMDWTNGSIIKLTLNDNLTRSYDHHH